MVAEPQSDGQADSTLRVVQAILPRCSAAIGVLLPTTRTLRCLSSAGPESGLLLHDTALQAAYRCMSERATLVEPCIEGPASGRLLLSAPINGRDRLPQGVLQILAGQEAPAPAVQSTLEALTGVIADGLQSTRLNRELQHSLNQLFQVYEVGRLFNLATSLDDVLLQVRDQLAGTLNFRYCCIMLLNDRKFLVPEAGIGVDGHWMQHARPLLSRSVAARVLESGVAEQITDPVELTALDTPMLDGGIPPAGLLCVPLSTRMGILGFLELYTPIPYAFSVDEVFLLSVLALEVAAAVENSQLYASLREKEGRLTVLAHKLIHSQEEERRRIARDMHDGLAQMIVSAFQYVQAHAFSVSEGSDRQSLERGLAMLSECIDESRKVVFDLRPSTLDDFGLIPALRQHLATLEEKLGWQVEFSLVGQMGPLSPALETAIFRLVQEALSNARKHAATEKILVRLASQGRSLVITVRDWGRGFNVREAAARRQGQMGVMGMKERVALLNGTFHLRSRPGAGTLIRITLPLE